MTHAERTILQNGGTILPTRLPIPCLPNVCVADPVNLANEGFPRQLTQEDYNAIPIADQEAMSKLHGMDELHRLDAIASQHERGTKLKAIAKVQGNSKFAQNYNIHM